MSRQELGEAVNAWLWNTYGQQENFTYRDVAALERGEVRWPGERRREAFRAILGANSDAELGFYINRRNKSQSDCSDPPQEVESADPASSQSTQKTILAELLPGGDVLRPFAAAGRRIGQTMVEDLAARVHRLRLADDVLAGGDLIAPAFRELRAAANLYRDSTHSEKVGRALLTQVGELAQVAGWIASDAGHHDLAERAYQFGLTAARQAGDRPLAANLAGSLAYQHANIGREQEAVDLARAALEEAGRYAHPKVLALFFDRLAWSYAQARQPQLAMRALGEAHDALSADNTDEAPQWAYWVSREELEVMDARVFTELHRPLRAVPLLSTELNRYDATHARELALYLSWLAIAYADANEPEAAAGTAARMLDLSAGMASDRTAQRARLVLRRLASFRDVPEVRAVLAEHGCGMT